MKRLIALFTLLLGLLLVPIGSYAHDIGAATLSWVAPTQQDDGSPLTDLSGYKIYYGNTAGGPYSTAIDVDSAGVTTYVVDTLAVGRYYFVTTAYNTSGEESILSNEAVGDVASHAHAPAPPANLTVTIIAMTVYTPERQVDKLVLLPAGTVPAGTPCDPNFHLNGQHQVPGGPINILSTYIVPNADDVATWFGNVRPILVVAECG